MAEVDSSMESRVVLEVLAAAALEVEEIMRRHLPYQMQTKEAVVEVQVRLVAQQVVAAVEVLAS